MSPSRLEESFRLREDKIEADYKLKEKQEDIERANRIRTIFPTFLANVEGGKPYCGLHIHWYKRIYIEGFGYKDICPKCGEVKWIETLGYIDPSKESVLTV